MGAVIGLFIASSIGQTAKKPPAFTPSPHFIEVQSLEEFEQLVGGGGPVLVDFSAPWCGPCMKLLPTIHELADRYAGRAKVAGVDIGRLKDLAAKHGVQNIPEVRIYVNGKLNSRLNGARPKDEYVKALDEAGAGKEQT